MPTPEQAETLDRDLKLALGVQDVSLSLVCCEGSDAILYIGINESGNTGFHYRNNPSGEVRLPAEVMNDAAHLDALVLEAIQKGQAGDDWSQGHSLMEYPPARAVQERFMDYAAEQGELLKQVLFDSAEAEHRATAAMVIAYGDDKKRVVEQLTPAVKDPDESVRNNAVRALGVIAQYANENPQAGLSLEADPFMGLLDSVEFGDRNKGLVVLEALTRNREPELLEPLQERAMPSLIEMCRWKSWGHANWSCVILARIAGLPGEIEPEMRETVISQALQASTR